METVKEKEKSKDRGKNAKDGTPRAKDGTPKAKDGAFKKKEGTPKKNRKSVPEENREIAPAGPVAGQEGNVRTDGAEERTDRLGITAVGLTADRTEADPTAHDRVRTDATVRETVPTVGIRPGRIEGGIIIRETGQGSAANANRTTRSNCEIDTAQSSSRDVLLALAGQDTQDYDVPTMAEIWKNMKDMMTQMAVIADKVAPVQGVAVTVAPAQGAAVTTTPVPEAPTGGNLSGTAEVIEISPPSGQSSRKKMDYLTVLEHIARLGTKHFTGGSDPMVADEWRSRLVRNFRSTRCPSDYQKDIAVHFLEGDAHNWWLSVEKRRGDQVNSFAEFEREFNRKYFPAEAFDKLECKFLELVQGRKTVREYEEEFNRLRRYVGRELEDEYTQVRRFLRGLRTSIRIPCSVRTFGSVSELVEKAALVEESMMDEDRKSHGKDWNRNGSRMDRKRRYDKVDESGKTGERRVCSSCGKMHSGQCRRTMGLCLRCGSADHRVQNCPEMYGGSKVTSDERGMCYYCKKPGHIRRDCPELRKDGHVNRGGNEPSAKRQAGAPRVYELTREPESSGNYDAITGMSLSPNC